MNTTYLRESLVHLNPSIKEEEWNYIANALEEIQLKKKAYFLKAGDIQAHIGFLNKGLIREYLIDQEGNEKSIRFIREKNYVTDYPTLLQDIPTPNSFVCIEDCELILIPLDRIRQAYERFPAIERFGRLIAENVLINLQDRIDDFQFLSAEERYVKFMKKHPDLFQRVSLSHLASFLGIQRPSLSRIRKKLS